MAKLYGKKTFFQLVPRYWFDIYANLKPLSLKISTDKGIEVKPEFNIKVSDLNQASDGTRFKHFYNQGYSGITFSIDVIIKNKEKWDVTVYNWRKKNYRAYYPYVDAILEKWVKEMEPLYVVTDSPLIPNGNYLITDISSQKQTLKDYTEWTLEFTTYRKMNVWKYKNDNSGVQKVLKKVTAKNTKQQSALQKKLSRCHPELMKYTGSVKKVLGCNNMMQQILVQKGFLRSDQVDGWFGQVTANALKKFQQKYQKTYKLKVTGRMDKATLNALCKV